MQTTQFSSVAAGKLRKCKNSSLFHNVRKAFLRSAVAFALTGLLLGTFAFAQQEEAYYDWYAISGDQTLSYLALQYLPDNGDGMPPFLEFDSQNTAEAQTVAAWCGNASIPIWVPWYYHIEWHTLWDPVGQTYVGSPGNMKYVDYLLRMAHVGVWFQQGYTIGEIQGALWTFVNPEVDWHPYSGFEYLNSLVEEAYLEADDVKVIALVEQVRAAVDAGEGGAPEHSLLVLIASPEAKPYIFPEWGYTQEWWDENYAGKPWQPVFVILDFDGCVGTGTIGYWKTHPDAWPTEALDIGGETLTKEEALLVLWAPARGDKRLILMKQLIAAKLNVLVGNPASCIIEAIVSADAWLKEHINDSSRCCSHAWKDIEIIHQMLTDYNEGKLCAISREECEESSHNCSPCDRGCKPSHKSHSKNFKKH